MAGSVMDVLLVEVDRKERELALRILRTHDPGLQIRTARDGQEALDFLFPTATQARQASGSAMRAILLALELPKVGGLEVLRRIRGDPHLATVPVVVLSSSRRSDDMLACYDAGANSYIVKPADPQRLSEVLRQVARYWLSFNQAMP